MSALAADACGSLAPAKPKKSHPQSGKVTFKKCRDRSIKWKRWLASLLGEHGWLQSKDSSEGLVNFSHIFNRQFASNLDQSKPMVYRARLETIGY